ncbi:hypothetical protein [Streptomyces sp. CA-106110]|uniref:hypothetical protein n=1 Tax=Streptomyces sp. CA-106110 TaxID=3240044 RepID=UPI003D8D7A13
MVEPIDTGDIHDDPLTVARELLAFHVLRSAGLASLRSSVAVRVHRGLLAEAWTAVSSSRCAPPGPWCTGRSNGANFRWAVTGGVIAHALATPSGPDRESDARGERFTLCLVDLVLRGARCRCPTTRLRGPSPHPPRTTPDVPGPGRTSLPLSADPLPWPDLTSIAERPSSD